LGKPLEDIIGRPAGEVLDTATHSVRRPYIERCLNGETVEFEGPLRSPTFGERIFHRTYIPEFGEDGRVEFVITIGVDVTEQRLAERRIRESERDIRLVNDAVPLVIARLDRNLRYLYVNAYYAALMQRPATDFVGRHASEVVGEEALRLRQPYVERCLAGETLSIELEIDTPARGRRVFAHTFVPVGTVGGVVEGYIVIALDVTERKRDEDALRRKSHELELIFDALPMLVAQLDSSYRFRFVNRAYAEYYAVDGEAIIGRGAAEFHGPEK
jgi:PAS domain S-box-containing protein